MYDKILAYDRNGESEVIADSLPCLNSLTMHEGIVYASITTSFLSSEDGSPILDQRTAARIIKLNQDNSVEDYFVFPDDIEFIVGSLGSVNSQNTRNSCSFGSIMELTFDNEGNLFVSNNYTDAIYKITPTKELSLFASELLGVSGLAFYPENEYLYAGTILTKDVELNKLTNSSNIYAISPEGEKFLFYSFPLPSAGDIGGLIGKHGKPQLSLQIEIDANGNLYVADSLAGEIVGFEILFTPECSTTCRAPSTPVLAPGETNPKETGLLAAKPSDIIGE